MNTEMTGQLIAARRRELGLSQTELAQQLHVTDKAVSRWETGRGMPAVDSLEPLAEALGLSVSELLSGKRLTAEELPKAAGGQIVESMRKNARMVWRGVLDVVLLLTLIVGFVLGYHWVISAPEADLPAMTKHAADYLLKPERDYTEKCNRETFRIVMTEKRGDYLGALCTDGFGYWSMCEFERDEIFRNRWFAAGGSPYFSGGALGSWNFGNPQEAVIIFRGGDLPEEAAYYTFCNSGITYICPIENRQVLDVFLLPDTDNIATHDMELLDQNGIPLDGKGLIESKALVESASVFRQE